MTYNDINANYVMLHQYSSRYTIWSYDTTVRIMTMMQAGWHCIL